MQWKDLGIIINLSKANDKLTIATILTSYHGLQKGSISRKNNLIQGSLVIARWSARLEEHLGSFTLEEKISPLYSFKSKTPSHLDYVASALELISILLPERFETHELFLATKKFIYGDKEPLLQKYWAWERIFLRALGSDIKWDKCQVCGEKDQLEFFDPIVCSTLCNKHRTHASFSFSPYKIKTLTPEEQAKQWLNLNNRIIKNYLMMKPNKRLIAKELLLK